MITLEPPARGNAGFLPKRTAYSFRYDHVLGTSLEVLISASHEREAESAVESIFAEIERLRHIFSLVDPESELSRLNHAVGSVSISADLRLVLRTYEDWQQRTGGACSAQTGGLVHLWQNAERLDRMPSDALLASFVSNASQPGWMIDDRRGVVTRTTDRRLDLNSVAKGYIIEQAANSVRAKLPGIASLLLNLGGDMTMWGEPMSGDTGWKLGIQNPFTPEDNAKPLTTIVLPSGAVATSGGYQRFYTIAGRRYSHLLDPRTGRPAEAVAAATVIAPSSTTANVLATSLCILNPREGLRLIAETPGAECLVVTASGTVLRSPGFAERELPGEIDALPNADDPPTKGAAKAGPPVKDSWPAEFQVTVALELPKPNGGRYKRPYVAIWAEDANDKTVRNIAVWGTKPRWIPELSVWWKTAKNNDAMVQQVTRATRSPGKYEVVWDGKDDQGKGLPQGIYTIRVEVNRQHGRHATQVAKLACLAKEAELTLEKTAEAEATIVKYGKKP